MVRGNFRKRTINKRGLAPPIQFEYNSQKNYKKRSELQDETALWFPIGIILVVISIIEITIYITKTLKEITLHHLKDVGYKNNKKK